MTMRAHYTTYPHGHSGDIIFLNMQQLKEKLEVGEAMPIKGRVRIFGRDAVTGEIVADTGWKNNLVMLSSTTGKGLILQRLIGVNTYSLNITNLDIGTGTTPPAVTDTMLDAAVARADNPVASIISNVASFQFFIADADLPNGTYTEVGTFVDGTDSVVDTGQIFNRALFGTGSEYVKTTGVNTTIQVDFTL